MDAEKIAPLTSSPLDSARGRGKHTVVRTKLAHPRIEKQSVEHIVNAILTKPYLNTLSPTNVGLHAKK
jgi:hypothetical protein